MWVAPLFQMETAPDRARLRSYLRNGTNYTGRSDLSLSGNLAGPSLPARTPAAHGNIVHLR